MGDWIYYISFMKMKDVAERVKPAQEIHPGKTLNELIQRRIKRKGISNQGLFAQSTTKVFQYISDRRL